jgi:TonB-linked SusC/RagA family outer membrane protein
MKANVYKKAIKPILLMELFLAGFSSMALCQNTVSGTVTDAQTGETLPGVNIKVKGTTTGTATDAQGLYSLNVPSMQDTLIFSFIGYKQQAIPIKGRNTINVSMKTTIFSGKQMVVIGYGSEQKRNLTGSISSVSSSDFKNMPVTNVGEAIMGQMAGVTVQQTTGQPGAALQIRVRGVSSITAGNTPLYVVDGVPVPDITNLNPDNIASIEVLKDAASAAIYGARGANGVVLIKTKHGHKGPTQYNFSAKFGVQQITKKLDLLGAKGWENLYEQIEDSAWVARGRQLGLDYKASDPISFRQQQLGVERDATYIPDSRWNDGKNDLDDINWQDAFFRIAPEQKYQLSASGGTNNLTYRISGNFLNQKGIAVYSGYRRFGLRANFNTHLTHAISFDMEIAPTLSLSNGGNLDGKGHEVHQLVSIAPVAEPGVGLKTAIAPNPNYYWAGSAPSPVYYQKYATNDEYRRELYSQAKLQADLYKGLGLKIEGAWTLENVDHKEYYPTRIQHHSVNHSPGSLSAGRYRTGAANHYLFESLLTYNASFGPHNLNIIAGYTLNFTRNQNSGQRDVKYPNDLLTNINNSTSEVDNSVTDESQVALSSFLSRVKYNYKEKYLVTASIRRDGSSRFGTDNKWGYFPAFSVGWRINQEAFMQSLDWLNNLKLRFTWGETGNNEIPDYASYGALGVYNYSFGGSLNVGYGPSSISNPNLGWEKEREQDYGLNLGVFNNRVQFTGDYYHKITSGLLLNVPVPLATGFSSAIENIGEVRNTGLELSLNAKPFVNKFLWQTSFHISFNHNEVLHLGPDNAPIHTGFSNQTAIIEVGKPLNDFYMYKAIGVYMNKQDLQNSPHMASNIVGDVKYKDVNGDGKITPADRTIVGHSHPTFTWGFQNGFKWKGFDFSFLIQGQGGNSIYSILGRAIDRPGMGASGNKLGRWRDRWRSSQDPGNGHVPRIDGTTGSLYDSRWLYDATYWRIRNITLGYTLPKGFIKSLNNARIYVSGQNLYTFDHYYDGYNPDANNNGGGDYGGYPLARIYSIGLKLDF